MWYSVMEGEKEILLFESDQPKNHILMMVQYHYGKTAQLPVNEEKDGRQIDTDRPNDSRAGS